MNVKRNLIILSSTTEFKSYYGHMMSKGQIQDFLALKGAVRDGPFIFLLGVTFFVNKIVPEL